MAKKKHKQVNITSNWHNWTFDQLMEEYFVLAEVQEIPSVADDIQRLLQTIVDHYPKEATQVGIKVC